MAEFAFSDIAARLVFPGAEFELPLCDGTTDRLRRAAEELQRAAPALSTEREITEAVCRAVDGALGPGAAAEILCGRPDAGAFDALDVFRFIYEEYAAAWRRRLRQAAGRRVSP